MSNKNLIIAGVVIFVAVVAFPFWFNMGKAAPAPEPELTARAKAANHGQCVMPTDFMKSDHMKLLDLWRHSVVRNGERTFVNSSGQEFNMSLSNTCLDCHSNKKEFCDRCHDYASVRPYCWDCHIENPKETE
ncbi:MAG: sulfate reduction electron transfer complex DsrMKJOP subunit DsrJ [Deltaproteobacteria bacterium]|nr:sulfate reduction electron transfer complex DsrMKJOP subunit DsrJ [Deltaproteobacteria bacterium]